MKLLEVTSEDYTNTIMFIFKHKVPICRKNSKKPCIISFHDFFSKWSFKNGSKNSSNDNYTMTNSISHSVIVIIFIFTNNAEALKFPLVLRKSAKKFVKWHFKLRQMAIGHRLKFFTLINQKIREVKKGMTNGHWSLFKISFHVKNLWNEMMQFLRQIRPFRGGLKWK